MRCADPAEGCPPFVHDGLAAWLDVHDLPASGRARSEWPAYGEPGDGGGWPDLPPRPRDLDDLGGRVPVGAGDVDGDGDGDPDTVVVGSGDALVLFTDLDGDGLADQELRLGAVPDEPEPDPWWEALGDLVDAALGR